MTQGLSSGVTGPVASCSPLREPLRQGEGRGLRVCWALGCPPPRAWTRQALASRTHSLGSGGGHGPCHGVSWGSDTHPRGHPNLEAAPQNAEAVGTPELDPARALDSRVSSQWGGAASSCCLPGWSAWRVARLARPTATGLLWPDGQPSVLLWTPDTFCSWDPRAGWAVGGRPGLGGCAGTSLLLCAPDQTHTWGPPSPKVSQPV